MFQSPLDDEFAFLGPIPAAFRIATDAAYAHLRRLQSTFDGAAEYSTRTNRSIVLGIAIEGGMADYRNIDLDPDIVASISPNTAEIVRRVMEA